MRPKMKSAMPSKFKSAASPNNGMNCGGSFGGLKLVELIELKITLSKERTS